MDISAMILHTLQKQSIMKMVLNVRSNGFEGQNEVFMFKKVHIPCSGFFVATIHNSENNICEILDL
jgi:hypothetical protein